MLGPVQELLLSSFCSHSCLCEWIQSGSAPSTGLGGVTTTSSLQLILPDCSVPAPPHTRASTSITTSDWLNSTSCTHPNLPLTSGVPQGSVVGPPLLKPTHSLQPRTQSSSLFSLWNLLLSGQGHGEVRRCLRWCLRWCSTGGRVLSSRLGANPG